MKQKSKGAPTRHAQLERPEPARHEGEAPARRDEVLDAGLVLISESGVAGASLRKLAARLGMSQPSLYHYFKSKDELVTQIIERCGARMVAIAMNVDFPKSIEDVPRFAHDAALALWAGEEHPRNVRFLFAVALESPEHRKQIQRVFEERVYPGFGFLADAFGRDAAEREDLRLLARTIAYAIGLALMEERAFFGAERPSPELLAYADFVKRAAERVLASRALGPIAATAGAPTKSPREQD